MEAIPLEVLSDEDHFVFFINIKGQIGEHRLDQIHADAWRMTNGKFIEGYFLPDDPAAFNAFLKLFLAEPATTS